MEKESRPNRIVEINGEKRRLSKVIDATATDLHHLMGKCNQHKYNIRTKENLVRILRREHDALNRYFKDKQSPREQLQKVFDLVTPVLSEQTRKDLAEILNRTDEDFYIQSLIKCSKHKLKKKERLKSEPPFQN